MKVIVGAGGVQQPGWLSLEESDLDITQPEAWARFFPSASLDCVFAEHVWEHLTPDEAIGAALNCFAYLKPGGTLRIAVPDGFHPDSTYISWVAPGIGFNGDDHKQLYNYLSLCSQLTAAGFDCFPKEFFNERGQLFTFPLGDDCGHIKRTVRRYPFSLEGSLVGLLLGTTYTSLTVDARKPASAFGMSWL
jgi:predicted SAM-dependent methyltransferase